MQTTQQVEKYHSTILGGSLSNHYQLMHSNRVKLDFNLSSWFRCGDRPLVLSPVTEGEAKLQAALSSLQPFIGEFIADKGGRPHNIFKLNWVLGYVRPKLNLIAELILFIVFSLTRPKHFSSLS